VSESEEQVARQLAEELRNLKVEDVVVSVLIQISAIGYRRLGLTDDTKEDRDLGQAKLAIDTMKSLTPVLEQVVPAELLRDFNSSVANLQLAYAKAASEEDTTRGQTPGPVHEKQETAAEAGSRADTADEDSAETGMAGGQTPASKEDDGER
jgi:hypothetical protein